MWEECGHLCFSESEVARKLCILKRHDKKWWSKSEMSDVCIIGFNGMLYNMCYNIETSHLSVVASTVAASPLQDPNSDQYALEAACALPGDDDGITAPAGPRNKRSNNDKK